MEYLKVIRIGDHDYSASNIIDNDAKIKWKRSDVSLMHEKTLDGSYIFYRSMNQSLYDEIMAFTHCSNGYITVYEGSVSTDNIVARSIFTKRDIEYDLDRCILNIKFKYYDQTGFKNLLQKELNIITSSIPTYRINYSSPFEFEFITCVKDNYLSLGIYWDTNLEKWAAITGGNELFDYIPVERWYCPTNALDVDTDPYCFDGWTFYKQINTWTGLYDLQANPMPKFNLETTWFREIKLVPNAIDPDHNSPPPQGDSAFEFIYLEEVTINGNIFNKYVRFVDQMVYFKAYEAETNTLNSILFNATDYFGLNEGERTLTRARRIIDVLNMFKVNLGLTTLVSDFFTNAINPISGKDLRYSMIMQNSDAIFVNGVERSDAARNGYMSFEDLMEQLWAMFQVTYFVDGTTLYVEHINYFLNNMSYTEPNIVGIDLVTDNLKSVIGKNKYTYEGEFLVREKFKFSQAWNLDFIGSDIEYACVSYGDTKNITADLITTDIDVTYIDTSSNDGFVMFDVLRTTKTINGITFIYYNVVNEIGKLSGVSLPNAHFSWANLHHYYYKTYRAYDAGIMNNVYASFTKPQKMKIQTDIEFPYCLSLVDGNINKLVKTQLGDGQIIEAEYNFKTRTLKLKLAYD